jgi:hypothetical protein
LNIGISTEEPSNLWVIHPTVHVIDTITDGQGNIVVFMLSIGILFDLLIDFTEVLSGRLMMLIIVMPLVTNTTSMATSPTNLMSVITVITLR